MKTNVEKLNLPDGIKLRKHQIRYLNERNLDRDLLVHEMQTGKTAIACCWILLRPQVKFLIACPKSIIKKWQRELEEWGAKADVVSRDEIKKVDLSGYGGIILDEAQDFFSPAFTKQRSARTTAIYNYVRYHPKAHVLLLSATPIRSTSWNCHTAACFLGKMWPVNDFRNKFFYMTDMFGRYHYEPVKTWRTDIRPYLESISDIVLAKDVAEIPKRTHETILIPWTKAQEDSLKNQYLEPAAEFNARRRAEQGGAKWQKLKELIDGHRKVIVVVYFRDQIEDYIKRIGNDRQVFVLHGGVKDQDAVIEAAKDSDDAVFLVQAGMGAGFSASEFSVMIYASMSFKYVDYIQSSGRMNSFENSHENKYIYLLGGRTDKSVFEALQAGHDFNPLNYMLEYTDEQRTAGTSPNPKENRGRDYTPSRKMVPGEVPF